jgi:hypothetical protein
MDPPIKHFEGKDRRRHRRLELRLPLRYGKVPPEGGHRYRTATVNISTGGLYFTSSIGDLEIGHRVVLELGMPANVHRFPPRGKMTAIGRVVRIEQTADLCATNGAGSRYGIAAQFEKNLRLSL